MIWMDDYGSGYSNFNVISKFRFQLIKIDQKAMKDLNPSNKIIMDGAVQIAKKTWDSNIV